MLNPVFRTLRWSGASVLLAATCLVGCKTREDRALDQAKAQAAASKTAQQIQYIDQNGDTVTTTVQPPVAGQPQQIATTTAPPPPGPPPHRTRPVITAVPGTAAEALASEGGSGGSMDPGTSAQPASGASPAGVAGMTAQGAAPNGPGSPAAPTLALTLPAGTELAIRVNQHISVKHTVAGDRFTGEVVEPVSRDGAVVIPRGTHVSGRIDEAHRRGHFKGRSVLELRLTAMSLNGYEYSLDTHDTIRTKKGKGKRSSAFIGGLTGAGMLIGGIASGGAGLAIGAAAGAGSGTLLAGTTGNRDIDIPAESVVHFRLSDPLVVQNP